MMPAWVTPEPHAAELLPAAVCDEQRLWRACLVRLLLDARAWQDQRFTQAITQTQALDGWLMIRDCTRDFQVICQRADIDPDALRAAFMGA